MLEKLTWTTHYRMFDWQSFSFCFTLNEIFEHQVLHVFWESFVLLFLLWIVSKLVFLKITKRFQKYPKLWQIRNIEYKMNGNIGLIQNYADFYSKYVDFFFFFQKHYQLIFQIKIKVNNFFILLTEYWNISIFTSKHFYLVP